MSGTGRKLLLCCKRIIQSGKHLIKRACKTRNLIVCIWNFKRLRKILGLYFIDFVTESSQRQQCTAADKYVPTLLRRIMIAVAMILLVRKRSLVSCT